MGQRPKPGPDGVVVYKLNKNLLPAPNPVEIHRNKAVGAAFAYRSRPTEKQIEFALSLLERCGYSTSFTDERFEDFGLRCEPGTNVEAWLAELTVPNIKLLIDDLKQRPMEFLF